MTKLLTFLIALFLVEAVYSQQVIENPSFRVRAGSILTIKKIERSEAETKLHVQAVFLPHWWITCDSTVYLEDTATKIKYYPTAIEGTEFNKHTVMPASGEMDIVITYPPLPPNTTSLNWIDPNSTEHNTYDISLLPSEKKKKGILDAIHGNWIVQDGTGEWLVGIYDSLAIYDNKCWKYESAGRKGKKIYLDLKNEKIKRSLIFEPDKNGMYVISEGKGGKKLCGHNRDKSLKPVCTDDDFPASTFFHPDSTCIQGYLEGYDPCLGFSTAMMYLSNVVTGEDCPTVLNIYPDGRFESKFLISHPISSSITLQHIWIPFYIEPGQTLTMYINYESVMESQRLRKTFPFPEKGREYMGESAMVCRQIGGNQNMYSVGYNQLQVEMRKMTPMEYAQNRKKELDQCMLKVDSISKTDGYCPKSAHLLRNNILLSYGAAMLEFPMMRRYAKMDTTVREENLSFGKDYFSFLKQLPLNDETILACNKIGSFINIFEYTNFRNDKMGFMTVAGMKGNGEALLDILDTTESPFAWKLALTRHLSYVMDMLGKEKARVYLDSIKGHIELPFFISEGERIYDKLYSETSGSYELPRGKGTDIIRKITDKYKGKYVLIDFWSTGCGPCKRGIEATAALRKKYRNSKDVVFVYITSEEESPRETYIQYVQKNLEGEETYCIPSGDYHHLCQLFSFNAIPHHEIFNREGRVLRKTFFTTELEAGLKKLLDNEK